MHPWGVMGKEKSPKSIIKFFLKKCINQKRLLFLFYTLPCPNKAEIKFSKINVTSSFLDFGDEPMGNGQIC